MMQVKRLSLQRQNDPISSESVPTDSEATPTESSALWEDDKKSPSEDNPSSLYFCYRAVRSNLVHGAVIGKFMFLSNV